ncbi:sigma-54-dependent transcriptional regulator [Neisseria animalis]|uniref:Sigma-54-dependent Fis family transcriptional regulator n=1 Tax=Neisseria animalis TaxID=492 RepID=A0A5P3MT18_NEIAN|nr:sigma-54 dependent transcriptional regulator [Neisseria animalis]QEY23931.1 sigma-54-dependent Fis family transcriptional regulator [Neisseria animalis]ROW31477.1 sigma-54-dependent Fis family transcriptional regulator [Neisseria animalis]VEE05892.1 nitrogen assimilation regulatory protein NtrX [Neisseria animalis]
MRSSDILIVDDEVGIRDLLSEILQDEGYTVTLAENAEEARQLRYQNRPAMVLLDIWMPDCDGITLLKEWAKNGQLNMPVVMMSGHASIDTAVEATKIGALDFLEKPIALQKLLQTVDRALKHSEMQTAAGLSFDRLGNSPTAQELSKKLEMAAKQNGPVLLTGEAGSPFEAVARYFRKTGTPWVEAAKVEHLVDTPLELLQKAGSGVLYVGDIAQYSKNIQNGIAFLLGKADRYNVRIIAASSRSLEELLESAPESKLPELLSPTVIGIPSLRSQRDDIDFLVNQISIELTDSEKIPLPKFSSGALGILRQYDWPGNFDQLRQVIRTLALEAEGSEISEPAAAAVLGQTPIVDSESVGGFNFNLPLRELREELERRYFEYHIAQEGQNMSRVAQKVGLERTHLYRKLKQLGISVSRKNGEKGDE